MFIYRPQDCNDVFTIRKTAMWCLPTANCMKVRTRIVHCSAVTNELNNRF